jgi:hypothetical protein
MTTMRIAVMALLGLFALSNVSTEAFAQKKRMTYNECAALYSQRGGTLTKGARFVRARFIRQCRRGKIPS